MKPSSAQRDIINVVQSPTPTLVSTFVKVNALNRLLCYHRGSAEDRAIRVRYGTTMIEFPNGTEYACVTYSEAVAAAEQASRSGNIYAPEAVAILRRIYREYWPAAPQSPVYAPNGTLAVDGFTIGNASV